MDMDLHLDEGVGEQRLGAMKSLAAEAEQQSYAHRDRDSGVEVTVNGRGRVLDINIPQKHVYGANAETLAEQLTSAVMSAKQKVNNTARQQLFDLVGYELPTLGKLIKPDEESSSEPEPTRSVSSNDNWEDDAFFDDDYSQQSFLR